MRSALFAAVLFAVACTPPQMMTMDSGTPHHPGDPITEIGPLEGKVVIIAWPGYIERGATDPAYDWVTKFEQDTGCMVEVKIGNTSDEMVALMQAGGVDLVTASGDASLTLVYGGRLQQINTDLIPSFKNVDPRLKDAPWHTVGGKHYGVPYQWGANVLMYNTDLVTPAPTSWDIVFTEKMLADGMSNKGRIQAYDGPIYIADAALYLKAKQPALGITDPYELNQAQFDAAIALLRAQHPLINKYWHDAAAQISDFSSLADGGTPTTAASGSWPYQVNTLQFSMQHVASVIPTEGATGWADTTMMHIDAPHPNCAYKWMEHSLDLKLQGDLAAWFGSVPVMTAACTGNMLLGDMGCKTNGSDSFAQVAFWKTPTADCGNGMKNCIPYYQWQTSYLKVIAGQ